MDDETVTLPSSSAGTAGATASSHGLVELEELNTALRALAEVFPNVRPEVFREMLTTLSRKSRAQVVAEHLLRSGDKWIRGRWRLEEVNDGSRAEANEADELDDEGVTDLDQTSKRSGKGRNSDRTRARKSGKKGGATANGQRSDPDSGLVPLEETFRMPSYKTAVETALRNEFSSLSRSTINGVLAEQNHCYTLARPILAGLAARTWRSSIGNFVMRAFGFGSTQSKSKSTSSAEESHYMLQWIPGPTDDKTLRTPYLRHTGDAELDKELRTTVLQPLLNRRRKRDDKISLELALLLNEHEAELAGALFECQVCFADVPFEQVAACSGSAAYHLICLECVQRSVTEAVYGQSWDLTIDHVRGQVACVAPSHSKCDGCVPQALVKRAVLSAKGGANIWRQFQAKLVNESLQMSGLTVIKCPFCNYAEIDSLYLPSKPTWTLNLSDPLRILVLLALTLAIITVSSLVALLLYIVLYLPLLSFLDFSFTPSNIFSALNDAWRASLLTNVRRSHLPQRFSCRSPTCGRASCIDCHKQWRDPHRCHEDAALSLRTTVEAARTAALKRTCPKCGVSFVKASGCNKMVCVCSYSMCYVCRQGLKVRRDSNNQAVPGAVATESDEGYRHFCQHFRPNGGRCTECDKCDLYRAEDEDEIVRRAGQRAEREWRERNRIGDEIQLPDPDEVAGQIPRPVTVARSALKTTRWMWNGLSDLSLQKVMEWWISKVLICRLKSGVNA